MKPINPFEMTQNFGGLTASISSNYLQIYTKNEVQTKYKPQGTANLL